MIFDFLEYEHRLGRLVVSPRLKAAGVDVRGKSVLDVGCGYGGVLLALDGETPLGRGLGLDLDGEMIAAAIRAVTATRAVPATGALPEGRGVLAFRCADFLAFDGEGESGFDLVLMRDVLEHIVKVEEALERACRLLAPGGCVYLSFAPFYSPFGGHQHNATGPFSFLPWLQCLPEVLFRRLLCIEGNSYKSGEPLRQDMESVLSTRLTLPRFRRAVARAGLAVESSAQHIIRPDYRLKFGLPPLRFPALPGFEDLLCTGVDAILRKA